MDSTLVGTMRITLPPRCFEEYNFINTINYHRHRLSFASEHILFVETYTENMSRSRHVRFVLFFILSDIYFPQRLQWVYLSSRAMRLNALILVSKSLYDNIGEIIFFLSYLSDLNSTLNFVVMVFVSVNIIFESCQGRRYNIIITLLPIIVRPTRTQQSINR